MQPSVLSISPVFVKSTCRAWEKSVKTKQGRRADWHSRHVEVTLLLVCNMEDSNECDLVLFRNEANIVCLMSDVWWCVMKLTQQFASVCFELRQLLIKLCSNNKEHWVRGISFSSSIRGVLLNNWLHKHKILSWFLIKMKLSSQFH